jgi:LytS/YehU family sensor histidine kinase
MWFGNAFITDYLDSKVSWLTNPVKRLILGIIAYIVYPIIGMFAVTWIFYNLWGFNSDGATLVGSLKYGIPAVIITFLIVSFISAHKFFISWRQLAVNEEKVKKEAVVSQYESLKNQVNPHFLFNSLNVLNTLIYKDQDEAAKFVKQLSNVYRYVLDVKDQELVSLDQEIEFIRSFAFMQQTRHTTGLDIAIQTPENSSIKVVPLSLQMLVENAIKHNEISEENPLKISIRADQDYIIVSNNLQKRATKEDGRISIGLENIRSRYKFLTDQPVIVNEGPEYFSVKIPVLNLKEPVV